VYAVLLTVAQWLVLIYHFPVGVDWFVASLLGWMADYLIAYACNTALARGWYRVYEPLSSFLIVGLAVGVAQGMVFKRHSRRAVCWSAANVVGWALLGITWLALRITSFCPVVLIGAMPAAVTGIMLAAVVEKD
jgi:hypothetical protein